MQSSAAPRAKVSDPRRFHLDKTINLGHLLTTLALLLAGASAWMKLDSRVTTMEAMAGQQDKREVAQNTAQREKFDAIRDELRDIRLKVDEIYRAQANSTRAR